MTDPLDASDDDLTIAAGPELDALMAELSQSRRDRTGEDDHGDDDLTVFGDEADETSHSLEPEPVDAPEEADDDDSGVDDRGVDDRSDDGSDGEDEDEDNDDDATVFGDLGQALTSGAVASGAVLSDPAASGPAVSDDLDVSDERSDQTDQPPDAPRDLSSEPVAEKPSPPPAISFETSAPPPPGTPAPGPSAPAPAPAPPPAPAPAPPPGPVAAVSSASAPAPVPAPGRAPAMSPPPAVSDSAQPWVPPASFPSPRREPPTAGVDTSGGGASRIGRVLAMGLVVVAVVAAGWVLLNRDPSVGNQVDPATPTPAAVESSE